ncbi:MAG: hypothetical protein EAZ57_00415 [Cytophagales bacterium]|nr:MAG: hypothetical protein EAZ67_00715 [Cytophagales bacterium]TAF62256.1 MAG: hypothetical protein EAZ57_00415 [Cytophagales bacterium]
MISRNVSKILTIKTQKKHFTDKSVSARKYLLTLQKKASQNIAFLSLLAFKEPKAFMFLSLSIKA